jgi:tRNA(Ile)-lysidine synthase
VLFRSCHSLQFADNRLTVIRPLLETNREEIEEYCGRLRLIPCRDVSNLSLSMLRNRVRHELLPLLESYNPGIVESLRRISRIAEDEMAFLDQETTRVWRKIVGRKGKVLIFPKEPFQKLAPALQRHLLRRAVQDLLGTLKDIEIRHIENILTVLGKPAGRRIILPEGLTFSIEYDRYLLGFHPEETAPFPDLTGTFDINLSGETRLPGWRIEARVLAGGQLPANPETGDSDGFLAYFDKEKVGAKIIVRSRQRGDWFQPLGMSQPKKVGEFMLDARIPRSWRDKVPVFFTPEQIIWIAGWRIDERMKVTPETRQVLCLKMVRWFDERRGKSRGNR